MTQEPAAQSPTPLPQTSSKRILPAFLLCFTVSAHRIYAGKYISGVVQMALAVGSFIWSYELLKDLIKIVDSNQDPMVMLQNVSDWEEAHGSMSSLPGLAMIGVGIWIAVDAARLLRGKFTDGKGNKITRWW